MRYYPQLSDLRGFDMRDGDIAFVRREGRIYSWAKNSRQAPDGTDVVLPSDVLVTRDGRYILQLQVEPGPAGADGADGAAGADGADGADGTSIQTFTAENKDAVTIKAGQPVAIHTSGIGVVLADASDPALEIIGLAYEDIDPTMSGQILVDGPMNLADWTDATGSATLDPRATYWLATTPGMLTTTAPTGVGDMVQVGGKSASPAILEVRISERILL